MLTHRKKLCIYMCWELKGSKNKNESIKKSKKENGMYFNVIYIHMCTVHFVYVCCVCLR